MLEYEYLIRQRDYLLDISRALTAQLSLNEVLRRILRSATEMLSGKAGLIALADTESDSFNVRASVGIDPALLHFFAPLLADIPRDPEQFGIPELNRKVKLVAQAAGIGLGQVIALPMSIGHELVGVVYIFRAFGGSFARNEVQILQSFANQAAIAVHNARLYEQMATEKQRLDAILRHSADGIMILKADKTIESINLAFARMTGYSTEEVVGMGHDDVVSWAYREPGMSLSEGIAGGWPLNDYSVLYVEGKLEHRSGSTLSVGITYAPLFDSHGRLRNIIGNVRDITKFKEAEEAKSTFISVISHELRTPVSLMKGYASTLRREDAEWDRDTVLNGLQVIEEEADKLARLIDNLLDVTRLQAGTIKMKFSPIQIDRLAERVAERFQTQTDQHTIRTSFPADLPPVYADEGRIEQVLANLLSNAIKYSPEGGQVLIAGKVVKNRLQVSVSDEGIGMPVDQQERVFERFYRVDNALSRETQGAGLGLYIVRSIVEAHGGTIWLESEPGRGTTFTFTLPLSQE